MTTMGRTRIHKAIAIPGFTLLFLAFVLSTCTDSDPTAGKVNPDAKPGTPSTTPSTPVFQSLGVTLAANIIPPGGATTASAIGYFSDGSTRDYTSLVTWSTDASANQVSVSSTGAVSTRISSMSTPAKIFATYSGVTTFATLRIRGPNFTNGQLASVVIGEPDFNTGTGGTTQQLIQITYGNPTIINDNLWLPDTGNNRILGFSANPTTNYPLASYVLGQSMYSTGAASLSAFTFSSPYSVHYSNGKLLVADYGQNRVMIWNAAPTTYGTSADVVVGQPDFVTPTLGTGTTGLYGPRDVIVAGGKMIVADSINNRVLIWNAVPTTSNAPADLVLGQGDFLSTSISANRGGLVASYTLNAPYSVWSDGQRLIVCDTNNHRVLGWNTFPTANGQNADWVLGQSTMTSSLQGLTPSSTSMNTPYNVTSNGSQLAVSDNGSNRVLIWNAIPTTSTVPADVVLGQSSLSIGGAATSQSGLNGPSGLRFYGLSLYVGDLNNRRYLIFKGQ